MVILVGKSASGKNIIQEELIKNGDYKRVVTYTTRLRRPNEQDGVAYHFISTGEYLKKKLEGFFVETTHYDTANMGRVYYGTSKECFDDDNGVLIMNPDGLKAIKNIPNLKYTSFYIKCDKKTLKKRLKKRGDNPKEAKRRLKADKKDFKNIEDWCDYTVTNGEDYTLEEVANIIKFFDKYERSK